MEQHAGIDVSLKLSSVCIVDATGKIVKETKVASEPEALVGFFKELSLPVTRIGLEAGPLSQWLHASQFAVRENVLRRHGTECISPPVKTECPSPGLRRQEWAE
jgi:transposase